MNNNDNSLGETVNPVDMRKVPARRQQGEFTDLCFS